MQRSTLAYLLAASQILIEGIAVGTWYAAEELDERPRSRGRVRRSVVTGVAVAAAGQAVGDLWFQGVDPDDGLAWWQPREAGALRRYLVVASTAVALLWSVERAAPAALRRAGVSRPHVAFGVLAGTSYALCIAPVLLRQARERAARGPGPVGRRGPVTSHGC